MNPPLAKAKKKKGFSFHLFYLFTVKQTHGTNPLSACFFLVSEHKLVREKPLVLQFLSESSVDMSETIK